MPSTGEQKIRAARGKLIRENPYLGYMALRLALREVTDLPTLATDGRAILFNSKYVDRLSLDECVSVLLHEIHHCTLGHLWRQRDRAHNRWNAAGDFVINDMLITHGHELPEGSLQDARYHNWNTERVYDDLDPDDFPEGCGMLVMPENEEEAEALRKQWERWEGEAQGILKVQAEVRRVHKKPCWFAAVSMEIDTLLQHDYSYKRPRWHGEFALPSLRSDATSHVVIAIDTSGSIDADKLSSFMGAMMSLVDKYRSAARKFTVIYADSKVAGVHEIDSGIVPDPTGFGGTDFRPALKHAAGLNPSMLIYFTDACGKFPSQPPAFPVTWVVWGSGNVPEGAGRVVAWS